MNGFDIVIKDNFLNEKLFQDIHDKIHSYVFTPKLSMLSNNKHPWFSCSTEENVQKYLKDKCEKILRKKLEINFCFYTMLATVEPLPHCDFSEDCDYQVIVYIKGNVDLHKGTGFYTKNKKDNLINLNTHVGFNENRAIIWHANTWHSPMNWAAEDQSKRYSIICQFKKHD